MSRGKFSDVRFAILGAGLMGKAIAFDLARSGARNIIIADKDRARARDVASFIGHDPSCARELDLSDRKAVASLMKDIDVAVSAASYRLNLSLTEIAIETKTHMCDLGGNPEIVDAQLTLHSRAKEAAVTIVPDCGLAPGLTNILVAHGFEEMDSVEDVQIRVGGLPQDPKPPLDYGLLFSAEGLINEYVEKARIVLDGRLIEVEPLTGIEEIEFPGIERKLEAFYTSGGTSTLPRTYACQALMHAPMADSKIRTVGSLRPEGFRNSSLGTPDRGGLKDPNLGTRNSGGFKSLNPGTLRDSQIRLRNLDYKTIRYAGHCEKVRLLVALGMTQNEPLSLPGGAAVRPREVLARLLETQLPPAGKDITLLRVTMRGTKDGKPVIRKYEMLDRFDETTGLSSMMRTTAFPTSITAQMIALGEITRRGVLPPEQCVPTGKFLEALARRSIRIEFIDEQSAN